MKAERRKHIRSQAITCMELTKGFTPEQRTNEIDTIDELSGYILELTNASKRKNNRINQTVKK